MGDRKPSDYFAFLKETAGGAFTEDAVYGIHASAFTDTAVSNAALLYFSNQLDVAIVATLQEIGSEGVKPISFCLQKLSLPEVKRSTFDRQ